MFLFHILFARIVDISICTVYVNMGRSKKGRIKQWKKKLKQQIKRSRLAPLDKGRSMVYFG